VEEEGEGGGGSGGGGANPTPPTLPGAHAMVVSKQGSTRQDESSLPPTFRPAHLLTPLKRVYTSLQTCSTAIAPDTNIVGGTMFDCC
jgi:hypothetical protein